MSEGELKKRFAEWLAPELSQEFDLRDASAILDEAAKEFPYDKELINNPETTLIIKNYLAILDWFIKWFAGAT